MPHKKAKRSVREEQQKKQGSNLAPGKESISNEAMPKSAARILNAFQVREDYKKKRKLEQDGSDTKTRDKRRKTNDQQLKIKSGESIQHFYRRVEDDMRSVVRTAVQTSKAVERKARNAELEAKRGNEAQKGIGSQTSKSKANKEPRAQPPPPPSDARKDPKTYKDVERPKEFAALSTSAPRRLNDIAQAPPELKKAPRITARLGAVGRREGILSMVQKSMMEQEREKAIAHYRMLKATRLQTAEG
ncbi:hypothetical protein P691DRAFT_668733 [Macrolepiota fuliginosa MF-IS2]|uniref:Coiled-coil domain-containing protein 137 n=1 Tax=Macrolepiota fuliginosa MF-IS2 TaxID=1400762 RepID=A0A9P5XED7_9AGAR|nr:hypothetical protein P691DRAFT_668733 [Macrolepiota fuliginosa MF-IS2]